LEVELAGLRNRGAQVFDTEIFGGALAGERCTGGAISVDQAGAFDFGPAAISEVALETGHAVTVRGALGDRGDVATAVGEITVAPDGAIAVGEAGPKIVGDTAVRLRIAERVHGTIEVALTGELDFALRGPRAVDRAAREEQHQREERHRA
jgi:hypothetical protein